MFINVGLRCGNDRTAADARAAHDDNAPARGFGELGLVGFMHRAVARAGVDDALSASGDGRIDEGTVGTGRAVNDVDLWQFREFADIEFTLDRVQANRVAVEGRHAVIDIAERT